MIKWVRKWVLKRAALRFVNRIRAEQGREPLPELPRGITGSAHRCPVANGINGAFNASVTPWSVMWYSDDRTEAERRKTSALVQRFIHAFDQREFPELVEPRA